MPQLHRGDTIYPGFPRVPDGFFYQRAGGEINYLLDLEFSARVPQLGRIGNIPFNGLGPFDPMPAAEVVVCHQVASLDKLLSANASQIPCCSRNQNVHEEETPSLPKILQIVFTRILW